MENKNRRIDYIDYAKGIAIILVLVCHIRGAYYADSIQNIIALFHNSTFFLISGVLFSIKSNNSMGEFLTKKIKRLIKPFCVWIIILLEWYSRVELFDVIITQNDVINKKPDPEGYMLAINKLHVSPQKTLIFEDSDVDIEAAMRAGVECMRVVGFNGNYNIRINF